jgi:hypothetical protein
MTPESLNSPLLDNVSLTHVSMEMRIRGDRLGTDHAFRIDGINKISADTAKQETFSMDRSYVIKVHVQRKLIQS